MARAIEEQIDVVTHVHKKVNYERTKPNSFQMTDKLSVTILPPFKVCLGVQS